MKTLLLATALFASGAIATENTLKDTSIYELQAHLDALSWKGKMCVNQVKVRGTDGLATDDCIRYADLASKYDLTEFAKALDSHKLNSASNIRKYQQSIQSLMTIGALTQ